MWEKNAFFFHFALDMFLVIEIMVCPKNLVLGVVFPELSKNRIRTDL